MPKPWLASFGRAKPNAVVSTVSSLRGQSRKVRHCVACWRGHLMSGALPSPCQCSHNAIVIYQRQLQKGNLVTLTVDGGPLASDVSSSTGFTKEELQDCFTLKEGCACDTKRKCGQRWPKYGKFPRKGT
jgi:hypothetical protein